MQHQASRRSTHAKGGPWWGVVLFALVVGCRGDDKADSAVEGGPFDRIELPADCATYSAEDWTFDFKFVTTTYSLHCVPNSAVTAESQAEIYRTIVDDNGCEAFFYERYDPCDAHTCLEDLTETALAAMEPGPEECGGLPLSDECYDLALWYRQYCEPD